MGKNEMILVEDIQRRIFTIRGVPVLLDTDLAMCYGVEVKRLNEQVKRNKERFPPSFCFQLTNAELEVLNPYISPSDLKSQFATASWGGRRTRPYAFTEQGVAMLSAVLKSRIAVEMSVKIIDAFVKMRHFILANAQLFQRLDTLELKQLETDKMMENILRAIESREIQPKQGIFYEGQIFDAHVLVTDIIQSAKRSIVIIDNYLDKSVLTILTNRNENVKVLLLTKNLTISLVQDVIKFNEQYPPIEIREFRNSHDRFIVIDDKDLYHFGASLKDMGKKWFAFSKMEMGAIEMISKLKNIE